MGSIIGDYIHYSGEGYDEHGITLTGEYTAPNTKSIGNLISQYLNSVGSGATKAELAQMERDISSFMTESNSDREKVYAMIEEALANKYQDEMISGQWDVQMAKLNGKDPSKGLGEIHSHRVEGGSKMYIDLKEITKKINKLEQIYLEQTGKSGTNTKAWRGLKETYQSFVGTSAKKLNSYDFLNNPARLKIEGSPKEIGKLRDQMNALIQQYASYPAIVGVEGMGFEYIVAAALTKAEEKGEEAFDTMVKAIKGDNIKVTNQYVSDNIDKKTISKVLGENTFLDINYNQREKIDVQVRWNGIDAKISAKNITFDDNHAWTSVQSGSPFLAMVQDVDPDFVNHWINVHAVEGKSQKKSAIKDTLDDTMKRVLFYKGLTGQGATRAAADEANIMIINDKTKQGGVTVIDMRDLYKRALEKTNLLSVSLGGKAIKDYKFNNVWAETWEERLAAIALQLHELKATIKFNAILTK